MPKELYWLTLTAAMTALLWVPYILDRIMVRGTMGALANPSEYDKPQSAWTQRMMAAHTNTVENLVVFAALVLTAQALNIHTTSTAFASAFFSGAGSFTSRFIPREFRCCARCTGGWIAQMMLVLAIFRMI